MSCRRFFVPCTLKIDEIICNQGENHMEKVTNQEQNIHTKIASVLKALLCAYVVTGALLVLLAFLMYQFNLDEGKISIGIIVIYVLANLLGGFVSGKCAKSRKFLWGLATGILYFALLLLISLAFYHSLQNAGENTLATFLLCAGGGMLGGMFSIFL